MNLYTEKKASELRDMRIKARRKWRITYDCMNAIVRIDRVLCKKRHKFLARGVTEKPGLPLLSVLKGISSSICKQCPDYDEEIDE